MSYPPDPHHPYGSSPGGAPYGAGPYQQQPPPPAYQQPPQAPPQPPPYGYPPGAGYPPQPGYGTQPYHPVAPWMPMPQQPRMPGDLVTARVLLFIAGALWALLSVIMLITGISYENSHDDLMFAENSGDAALAIGVGFFVIGGGLAALHITAASLFGRGAQGTRTMALVASSLNTAVAGYGLIQYGNNETTLDSPAVLIFWLGTAVLTLIFCSKAQAGAWFNRPRY